MWGARSPAVPWGFMGKASFPLPRLWLAPMAGYTDSAMRALCHEMGAEASVSEMISAKAVVYRDRKTVALGKIGEGEGTVFLQLFGREPAILAEAAALLAGGYCGSRPAGIDVNMGCPVPKIAGNREGSALLREPTLCHDIMRAMRAALPRELPLTAKIRLGWDERSRNAAEVAAALAEGGADAVFVHGRTRAAMYGGEADWDAIRALAEGLPIPLIGNGDIVSRESAERRFLGSACYGLMVGRGAVGNPFLFRELAAMLRGEPSPPPPTEGERVLAALSQLRAAIADKGEAVAVREARKQVAAYLHGRKGAAEARRRINLATTYAEVEEIFEEIT